MIALRSSRPVMAVTRRRRGTGRDSRTDSARRAGPECRRLQRALEAAVAGTASVVVIRGPAGSGKTALLGWTRMQAEHHPAAFTIANLTGVPTEAHLPYAGLDALQRSLAAHRLARSARGIGLVDSARGAAGARPADRLAVYSAVLDLLGAAAEERPLVLLVDDAGLLDTGSAEALVFAARRVRADPLVFLFAQRRDGRSPPSPLDEAALPTLDLGPLSSDAIATLVRREAAVPVADVVVSELDRLSEGSPLAVRELVALLDGDQLAGRRPLPRTWPLGERVRGLFAWRLDAQADDVREALLVLAAGAPLEVDVLVTALRAVDLDPSTLERAEAAGLVRRDDGRVMPEHPLLGEVIRGAVSPAQRRRAHQAIAAALAALPAEGGRDRRVWHLAEATAQPNESVALALEASGDRAQARSGYAAAAEAYQRAAQLTPARLGPDVRVRRLARAARAASLAGDYATTEALLAEAARDVRDPRLRADVAQLRAMVDHWSDGPIAARDHLVAAADEVADIDATRAVHLLCSASAIGLVSGRVREALAVALRARSLAEIGHDPSALAASRLAVAIAQVLEGDVPAARAVLVAAAARDDPDALDTLTYPGLPLTWAGAFDQADRGLRSALHAAREHGAHGALPLLLAARADLAFRTGAWDQAVASATQAAALAQDTRQRSVGALADLLLGKVAVSRGDPQGQAVLDRAERIAGALDSHSVTVQVAAARAFGDLTAGRYEQAAAGYEELLTDAAALGVGNPSVLDQHSGFVEAAAHCDRLAEAPPVMASLEAETRRSELTSAAVALARCRVLVADDEEADRAFEQAVALRRAVPVLVFDHARTQLWWGQRLRRTRRPSASRVHLSAAQAAFRRLRAAPWAALAASELRAAGGRSHPEPSGPDLDQLSPQEFQVSMAVARGLSNREVAETLFLSRKTVEFHLTNVYRKLGMRSRTELVRSVTPLVDASR